MGDQTSTTSDQYREEANLALAGYQLIEALLKTYINNYFQIAKSIVGDQIPFGFTGADYESAPLGRLLQVFSKICRETELVADLRSELPHRDQIAHRSMLILFAKVPPSQAEVESLVNELAQRNQKISELLQRLKSVHEKLIYPYTAVTNEKA